MMGTPVQHIYEFDTEHADALRGLWFLGDVHGDFQPLGRLLASTNSKEHPSWIVFLGDLDLEKPFDEYLAPLYRTFPAIRVAYIPGNHDSDTYEKFEFLTSSSSLNLHSKVTDLNGILVAGLGGIFFGRVWYPPDRPKFASQDAALNRGAFQFRGGLRPSPNYLTAIYPETYDALAKKRADILITHEAPAVKAHPHGFEALDILALELKAKRVFHGHHHDDLTYEYRKSIDIRGYDAIGVSYCSIRNGLGELILQGPQGW